jgi:hypothetical protein
MMRRIIGMHCRYQNWIPARKLLLEEISRAPSPEAYYFISYVCLKLEKTEEARRYLRTLLTMKVPAQIRAQVMKQLEDLDHLIIDI